MHMSQGSLGMLIKRYRAILKKCHMLNMLGGALLAGALALGIPAAAQADTELADAAAWNNWLQSGQTVNGATNVKVQSSDTLTMDVSAFVTAAPSAGQIKMEDYGRISINGTFVLVGDTLNLGTTKFAEGNPSMIEATLKANAMELRTSTNNFLLSTGKLYLTGNASAGNRDLKIGDGTGTLTLNGGFAVSRQLWTIVSAEGGYTLQSVDSGRYLDLSQPTSSKVNTAQEAVTLTISLLEDGTYTVTHTSGNALSHGTSGQYYSSSSATPLYFYKQTEVEPSMAPGAPSGSSAGQPFVKEDTNSTHFRIPALLTLDNGWIAAASDIRWRTDGDSPQNLDTIVSLSKDGGATWDWNVVNYYDDMADDATGQTSASFIDPSILQAEDGTVHMVVDACPSYVGLMYGNQMGWESSGFDDAGRLLVTLGTSGGNASKKVADYTYYADINNPSAGYSDFGSAQ